MFRGILVVYVIKNKCFVFFFGIYFFISYRFYYKFMFFEVFRGCLNLNIFNFNIKFKGYDWFLKYLF